MHKFNLNRIKRSVLRQLNTNGLARYPDLIEEAASYAISIYLENIQAGKNYFESQYAVISYILKTAKNWILNEIKRNGRTESIYRYNPESGYKSTDWIDNFYCCDIKREICFRDYYERALELLPEKLKQLFILMKEEYTQEEIAEKIGICEKTVRNWIAQIKSILKNKLPPP